MSDYSWYYDRDGQPITQKRWGLLRNDADHWRVREEYVGTLWVSTVWIGMDVGLSAVTGGPPEIFETMVFQPVGDDLTAGARDGYTRHYATVADAEAGHAETVTLVRFDQEVSSP